MNRLPEITALESHLAHHFDDKSVATRVVHSDGDSLDALVRRAGDSVREGAKIVLVVAPERDLQTDPSARDSAPANFADTETALSDAGLLPVHSELTLDHDTGFSRHQMLFVVTADDQSLRTRVGELLATGSASFAVRGDFGSSDSVTSSAAPVRVCIVTSELHGPMRNGGIGTSYTALAESLASDGQDVTILFVGDRTSDEPMSHWVSYYKERGLTLEALEFDADRRLPWQQNWIRRSHAACEWLRARPQPFDIIHYPECNGHGFHTALAKHQGRGFANTTLCVGAHSSTRWIYESSGTGFTSTAHLAQDFMEEMSIRWADVCVSPSSYLVHWMSHQGWQLPDRTIAQQNIQPQTTRCADERTDGELPTITDVRELVFFGRLEARKGLPTFCDALDLLAKEDASKNLKITFMGKETLIGGTGSRQILEERAEAGEWTFDWQIISDKDQVGANAYLQGDGRVAVMPSPVDNSPNTVLECIGLKIPFLATRAGGIPELIDPRDVAQCTFFHPEMACRPRAICDAVLRMLDSGIRPARRAVAASANERAWLDWHIHLPRATEVKVTPSSTSKVFSRSLLEWEDIGEEIDGDSFVLFEDEDHFLKSDASKQTLVQVAENTGADIVTCYLDEFVGDGTPDEDGLSEGRFDFPVGGAVMLSPFWNCFGPGPFLIRRSAWEKVQDLPLPVDGSLGDLREFFVRAIRERGLSLEVVAEPLSWQRLDAVRPEGDGAEPDPETGVVAILTRDADSSLRQLLGLFMSKQQQSDEMIQEYYDLRYRVTEGYDKLTAQFQDQSKWLEEREGVLATRESELAEAKATLQGLKAELKTVKSDHKSALKSVTKERDELDRKLGKSLGGRVGRLFGRK